MCHWGSVALGAAECVECVGFYASYGCVCVICLLVGSDCVMRHDPDIESIRSVSVECVFSCVCVCVCVSV
jgi:hypothetical protein